MKALVIDDDEIARELLVSTLSVGGYEVFELSSPIGATKILLDNQVDAVVIDVMMPEISGDKLAKMLRSNKRLSSLAIVLVSSINPVELERLRVESTANAVVQKSAIRKELVRTVTTVITNARARQ